MSTKIEWCTETVNPQGWGCWGPGGTPDNPKPCPYCYAKRISVTMKHRCKCEKCREFVPHWHPERLAQVRRWKKPQEIFWQDMGDLWHQESPDEQIEEVLETAACAAPQHKHLFLTKNPKRYLDFVEELPFLGWYGTTVTNQEEAEERMRELLYLRRLGYPVFLSCEPLRGDIDFTNIGIVVDLEQEQEYWGFADISGVIAGGMTGDDASPMHPDWPRSIRDQCEAAGVKFFFKSWGAWSPAGSPYSDKYPEKAGQIEPRYLVWDSQTRYRNKGKLVGYYAFMGDGSVVEMIKEKKSRILDGREHDDLAWRTEAKREDCIARSD